MRLSLNHQPFMTELPELKFTFQTRPGMRHRSGNSFMCKDAKCGMSPQGSSSVTMKQENKSIKSMLLTTH